MRAVVITIENNNRSIQSAARCMGSAPYLKIKQHKAVTPEDDLETLLKINNIKNLNNFKKDQRYSRIERCVSAFLSHLYTWKDCVELNEPTIIFEHDAIVVNQIPKSFKFNKVMTIAKPSYGNYHTPTFIGTGPLIQKRYFGGAHGYVVSPKGAKELIKKAETDAGPTDTFLNLDNFPFLQEYNPWLVEAKDTFTTIQNERGCRAKDLSHMVSPSSYEII